MSTDAYLPGTQRDAAQKRPVPGGPHETAYAARPRAGPVQVALCFLAMNAGRCMDLCDAHRVIIDDRGAPDAAAICGANNRQSRHPSRPARARRAGAGDPQGDEAGASTPLPKRSTHLDRLVLVPALAGGGAAPAFMVVAGQLIIAGGKAGKFGETTRRPLRSHEPFCCLPAFCAGLCVPALLSSALLSTTFGMIRQPELSGGAP